MYVVRVVGPSGYERYLKAGKLVDFRAAHWYNHPSECRRAIAGYEKKHEGEIFYTDFFDPRDPERHVDQ